MKTPDLLLPFNTAGASSELELPPLHRSSAKPAEPFDKMMNRALARPARDQGEKHFAIKKSASHPGTVRKSKPSVNADPNPAGAAEPSGLAVHDRSPKSADVDPAHDPESPAAPDAGKPTGQDAGPGSADAGNAAALQTLAASVAANQTTPAVPVISNQTKTSAEIIPLEMVGTTICSDPIPPGDVFENAAELTKSEVQSDAQTPASEGKKLSGTETGPAKKSGPDEGGIPITALLDQAKAVNETAANTADSALVKPHALTAEATGISAAQQTATMKNAEHAAKVAGMPEQSLPGVTLVAATVQEAFRPRPAAKAAARVESSDAAAPVNSVAANRPPATAETSSSNLISASSQTELRTRALDRTHDILALHGMQLRQSNTDSLHVIIKPGAGLQLSLQMKQTSDGIEAQAILQSGNFNELNQHWAELQQRLEERGIRLAPLGQDSATANSGNENFQRQSRQPVQRDALSAGAFAEFASASAPARTMPAAADTSRGWEGWA